MRDSSLNRVAQHDQDLHIFPIHTMYELCHRRNVEIHWGCVQVDMPEWEIGVEQTLVLLTTRFACAGVVEVVYLLRCYAGPACWWRGAVDVRMTEQGIRQRRGAALHCSNQKHRRLRGCAGQTIGFVSSACNEHAWRIESLFNITFRSIPHRYGRPDAGQPKGLTSAPLACPILQYSTSVRCAHTQHNPSRCVHVP